MKPQTTRVLAALQGPTATISYNVPVTETTTSQRVSLRTVRQWADRNDKFAMLTCYDATTAKWLWRGGCRTLLVGDTAAQFMLGHTTTLPVKAPFMLEITAAVRRGAPDAFIMADMPFGSYQCGADDAVENAVAFMADGGADVVKLEVDDTYAPLVDRMARAGVAVVAHLGSRPQHQRRQGKHRIDVRTDEHVHEIIDTAVSMADHGAVMVLLEAVPSAVSRGVVDALADRDVTVPVVGCGAGNACHGHVVVLHDLLGMTDWHAPFAKPMADLGHQIETVARQWVDVVDSCQYLRHDHPYD